MTVNCRLASVPPVAGAQRTLDLGSLNLGSLANPLIVPVKDLTPGRVRSGRSYTPRSKTLSQQRQAAILESIVALGTRPFEDLQP